MKLDDLTKKVRENFEQHLDHAKGSPFFQKFADKFFKDFDIDAPGLSARSAINDLKGKLDDNLFRHIGKNDAMGMGIDPVSFKELQKIIEKSDIPVNLQVKNTTKYKP